MSKISREDLVGWCAWLRPAFATAILDLVQSEAEATVRADAAERLATERLDALKRTEEAEHTCASKLAATQRCLIGQRESFERTRPLCSDHVDKMAGRGCLGCLLERAEAKLAEAERERDEARRAHVYVCGELQAAEAREKALRERSEALAGLWEHESRLIADEVQYYEGGRRDTLGRCASSLRVALAAGKAK